MDTVVVDYEGPMIWVRLTRTALDVPDEINIGNIIDTLKRAVADEFRTRFQTIEEFEQSMRGIFIVQNLNTPSKSWAWFDGALESLNRLTPAIIEEAIDAIDQSPQPFQNTLHSQRYGFFTQNPIRGAGKSKPPPYIKSRMLETWKEQTFHNRKINCGAFAIAYQQVTNPHQRLNTVRQKALEIQTKMQWGEYVTAEELLKYVAEYPEYRLTIIIQSINCYNRHTRAGECYLFQTDDIHRL